MRPFLSLGIGACLTVMGLCPAASAQDLEPNNSCATAQDAGSAAASVFVAGSLDAPSATCATDIDFFRFSGTPGESLSLWVAARFFTVLAVLDDDCRELDSSVSSSGLAFEVPASGHFKVAVGASGDGLLSGQGSVNSGPYAIIFSEAPPFVRSISGRAVDAESGAPIPAGFGRSAFVHLDSCFEGRCSQISFANADSDGRFRIERDRFGQRIGPGQYRLTVAADGYQPVSWSFTAGANQDVDLGDIAALLSELRVEALEPCIPPGPEGGTCRYTAQIRNNRRNEIRGTAFSVVTASTGLGNPTTFEASASLLGARGQRIPLRVPAQGTLGVAFEFDVPASLRDGTFICMQVFAGSDPAPLFNVQSETPSFCMFKEPGGRIQLASDAVARSAMDAMRDGARRAAPQMAPN